MAFSTEKCVGISRNKIEIREFNVFFIHERLFFVGFLVYFYPNNDLRQNRTVLTDEEK